MVAIVLTLAAIFGLLVGSFLNVVIWRVPRELSVVRPGSSCPSCGHMLRARENIPVISYLALKGKCSKCKKTISSRYPLIELLTMAAFMLMFYHFKSLLIASTMSLFVSTLLVVSVIDVETRKIPRKILYAVGPVITFSFLLASFFSTDPRAMIFRLVVGLGLGFLIFGALHFIAPRSMGMGDVRLGAFIGLPLGFFGIWAVVDFIYGSFLLGSIFGIAYAIRRSKSLRVAIPFGPFMSLAAIISLFIYPSIRIF